VKDQSHKDEMSAAIRGDFQRLRDRGVAATLAPRDDEAAPSPADVSADREEPEAPEAATALAEPVTEPQADEGDELPDADRPGLLARLLGR
jgi:hypothetical protein